MFRISRSRLGAHTSRMGDISPNRFKLDVLLSEGRKRRAVRVGGVTCQPRTCAISHVILRLEAAARLRTEEGVHLGLYVWDTHMLVRLSDTSNRHVWKHHEEYEVNLFSGYV